MKIQNDHFRSDLAKECIEAYSDAQRYDLDGIKSDTEYFGGTRVDRIKITSPAGAEKIGKPMGNYTSIELSDIKTLTKYQKEQLYSVCADELKRILPEGHSCLVAALGNRAIAADSQGPLCAESLIVTRHLKSNAPSVFTSLSLFELSCVVPDVLGNTGIESADIIKQVADFVKPDFIIAVDSLAAQSTERLGRVLQITDTGIRPGSGIGNRRGEISPETMGVPVIALGIPTVADATVVASDVIGRCLEEYTDAKLSRDTREKILSSVLGDISRGLFLTPKDTDRLSALAGSLIGFTISMALNPLLSTEEIYELIGR